MLCHAWTIPTRARIVTPMKWLPECAVRDGKHEADKQERENEDEAHPRKGDHCGEESACLELVAPG